MDKKKLYLLIGIVVAFMLVFGTISFFNNRIKMNPAGTIGNTAGNLYNDGLFCEYDDTVYFSNPADNGALYSMNLDESKIKKLNSLKVQNILAAGDSLYYFQRGSAENSQLNNAVSSKSFNRCNLKGKNVQGMTRDVVVSAQLVDNYIYMLIAGKEGPVFSKMKINKSDSTILANANINPACAENGMIYYNNNKDNHNLRCWDTTSDTSYDIWANSIWNPILYGDYVYYMDVENNYRLCRYHLYRDEIEVLTEDRVDCFNVGYGYIYYQKNGEDAQLRCMEWDGSNPQVIADGNYTSINMTSYYVYFRDFENETVWYHSPLGSSGYSTFMPE